LVGGELEVKYMKHPRDSIYFPLTKKESGGERSQSTYQFVVGNLKGGTKREKLLKLARKTGKVGFWNFGRPGNRRGRCKKRGGGTSKRGKEKETSHRAYP